MNREERNAHQREYNAANREEINRKRREYVAANRDAINSRQRELYVKQIEYRRAWARDWDTANRDKRRTPEARAKSNAAHRRWRLAHPEYFKENRDKINAKNRRSRAKHPLTNALRSRVISAIKQYIKGSARGKTVGSAVNDLGCSIPQFIEYISDKFESGMTWKNWGRNTWHLDHIRPLSSFDLMDPNEFKEAVHFTNYQPLWAQENLSKGRRHLVSESDLPS